MKNKFSSDFDFEATHSFIMRDLEGGAQTAALKLLSRAQEEDMPYDDFFNELVDLQDEPYSDTKMDTEAFQRLISTLTEKWGPLADGGAANKPPKKNKSREISPSSLHVFVHHFNPNTPKGSIWNSILKKSESSNLVWPVDNVLLGKRIRHGDFALFVKVGAKGGVVGWGEVIGHQKLPNGQIPQKFIHLFEETKYANSKFQDIWGLEISCGALFLENPIPRKAFRDAGVSFAPLVRGTKSILDKIPADQVRLVSKVIHDSGQRPFPVTPTRIDTVPTVSDTPALEDQLGRKAYAEWLAFRLNRFWNDTAEKTDNDPYMINLFSPWGGGKTTFVNLLEGSLKELNPNWVMVRYNAWKYQHISPPWWTLLDVVLQEVKTSKKWSLLNKAAEVWWRVWRGEWTKKGLALGVIILLLWSPEFLVSFLNDTSDVAKEAAQNSQKVIEAGNGLLKSIQTIATSIGELSAVLGTILALFGLSQGKFSLGSSKSAREYIEGKNNPLEDVRKHFDDLINKVDNPVMVIIDDLDRCDSPYVVKLLEGIQTLFRSNKVIFLVVADRQWIHTCFDIEYEHFQDTVKDNGRRLGAHFVEKAFQESIPLPTINEDTQTAYWQRIINIKSDADDDALLSEMQNRRLEIREKLEETTNDFEVSAMAKTSKNDPVTRQILSEEIVKIRAREKFEVSATHTLSKFTPYLDATPRALKRLVNAYAIFSNAAIISSGAVDDLQSLWDRAAMWAIVVMRWPLLIEIFRNDPKWINSIASGEELPEDALTGNPAIDKKLNRLIKDPEVQRVINDEDDIAVPIDEDIVREFLPLTG